MRTLPTIISVLATLALSAWPGSASAEPPTVAQRDAIEDFLAPSFVLPQTSIWQFADMKPYLGHTKVLCGKVNFQSAMRRYLGFHRFYATFDGSRVTLAQVDNPDDDPSGRLSARLDMLCGKG